MPRIQMTAALVLSALLAACATTPTPGASQAAAPNSLAPAATTAGASAVGYIHLKAFRGVGSREPFSLLVGRATFAALSSGAPDLSPTVQAPDSCTVVPANDRAAWVPEPPLGGGVPTSAGGEIAIREGSKRFLTLIRLSQDTSYFSGTSYTFSGLPAGLSVSVPGAAGGFPAFQSVPFPGLPAALTLSSPVNKNDVRLNTTFTWSGAQNGGALVYFWGRAAPSNAFFYCTARDDGSFSFPAATRGALSQLGFLGASLSEAGRVNALTVRQGDAVLSVNLYNLTAFN